MPKATAPIEDDPEIRDKVSIYEKLLDIDEEEVLVINPAQIDALDYDDTGFPLMPDDLTLVPSQYLGQLFQASTAWYEYIIEMTTYADQRKVCHKEIADLVKEHVKDGYRDQGLPKSDIDSAMYRSDTRYIHANAVYMSSRFSAERLDNRLKMISRRIQLVSREISRRSDETGFSGMGTDNRDTFGRTGRARGQNRFD